MRSSDWSSDVCSSDLIDLTTLETVDRPIVDVDMEPGERSRSFAHDAAERHALPTEPEHLRQPGQNGNAGVVGDPRAQRVLGECGDELVAGRAALEGRLDSVEEEAGDLPPGRPSGAGTNPQRGTRVTTPQRR